MSSTTPSQNQVAPSTLPSSSPTSTVESIFSPGSSASIRRLSISTSVSAVSFHSCISEKPKIDDKELVSGYPCLQCAILGLRCTLPREPLWKEQHRPTNYCRRCERSGEHFCILQSWDGSKYSACGTDDGEVNKRVNELLAPKRENWKWCMPKIPPGTRAGLRRVWTRWSDT